MAQLIVADMAELKMAVKTAMKEANEEMAIEKRKAELADRLYTVNEVRKRLGKAHNTIKKLITKGLIKTTKDGLISEADLNDYLQKA